MNEYAIEILAEQKLREARADAARRALVRDGRPPRRTLRARLGAVLIALGERLADVPAPQRSCAAPGASHG